MSIGMFPFFFFIILYLQQYLTKYCCSKKKQLIEKNFFQNISSKYCLLKTAINKSSFVQKLVMSQIHYSHLNACLHKESLSVYICTENLSLRE